MIRQTPTDFGRGAGPLGIPAGTRRFFYSGKKKSHYYENVIVADTRSCRIGYLSPTLPGSVHDKLIANEAGVCFPVYATVRSDLGFAGCAPPVRQHLQPPKSKMQNCVPGQNRRNRKLARRRVRIEHAIAVIKRSRIAKDICRSPNEDWPDMSILIACGLHNVRVAHRPRRPKCSRAYFQ